MKNLIKTSIRVLTNSERSSFACEKRWWFRYIEGLTTTDSTVPLRTGSLWHQLLAAFYRSQMKATWDEIADAVITPWVEQRKDWASTLPAENRDEVVAEDEELAALCRGMLQGYIHTYGKQDAERWEILHVEAQGARWLKHPMGDRWITDRATNGVQDGRKAPRRRWAYGGALDLLVRDQGTGKAWLVEHKTCVDTDLPVYLRKLHFDPQIRGYGWMLRDPLPIGDIKEPVLIEGVIYNVARKKVPRVPPLLKDGKALSRAKIDTMRDVFLAEILKHGFDPDDYADILEGLRNNAFFARDTYPFTNPELEEFERDVGHAALRIIAAGHATHHPRSQSQCVGTHGLPCPYQSSVCLEDGPMARKSFNVMTIRHPELRDDMAEPSVGKERNCQPAQNAVNPDPFA